MSDEPTAWTTSPLPGCAVGASNGAQNTEVAANNLPANLILFFRDKAFISHYFLIFIVRGFSYSDAGYPVELRSKHKEDAKAPRDNWSKLCFRQKKQVRETGRFGY
jgi:hypothetical protein